ncbi:pre-mRNA-splicing factor cwc22, partial [Homalodisca vitripennis]
FKDNVKQSTREIHHDKGIMDDVLHFLQLSDLHITKIVRIGKGKLGKLRPMKVSFRDTSEAISFFENLDSPKLSNLFRDSTVEVSRDRTLKKRYHLQEFRNSLADRERNVEKYLTIKYQNGVPMIVKKTKN